MPTDACVAPGARVTRQIPGRPVSFPYASAMFAAAASWRVVYSFTPDSRARRARRGSSRPDAVGGVDPVDEELVDQDPRGGAHA